MAYEIRRAGTQPLPQVPAPASPPTPEIAPQAPVNEEHHVIVRREIVVHEHYARMGDGTLIAILPPGAKPAYTPLQAQQPQHIEMLTRPMLVAPMLEEAPSSPLVSTPAESLPKKRTRQQKKAASPLFVVLTFLLASVAISILLLSAPALPEAAHKSSEQTKSFAPPTQPQGAAGPLAAVGVLQGPNSLTPDQVEHILASYNSPAKGQGQVFADLGTTYGIDDIYAVAFFLHESTMGTACPGWAGCKEGGQTTHNIGNIICASYSSCYQGFRDYPDWQTGIDDWYRLLVVEYIQGRGFHTVTDTIPVYCPVRDGCNSTAYVQGIEKKVTEWRATYPAAGLATPTPDSFVALTRCEQRADGWHVVGTIQNTGTGSLDIAFKDIQIHDTQTSDSFAITGDGTTSIAPGQHVPIDMTAPLKDGHSYIIIFERPGGTISFPISKPY